MAMNRFGQWPLILGAVLIVTGCVSGGGSRSDEPAPAIAGAQPTDRDIEAPDQFRATEKGLWDGRPSLGGVWIALSGVNSPRRVLIRNTENGKSIVGALFRRERENPGPRIQISSDAAEKLGILAGQPTELHVVALTREEPAETAPPVSEETTGEAAETGEQTEETSSEEVAAAAEAAIADANGEAANPEPVPETRSPSSFGRRRSNRTAPATTSAEAAAEVAETATSDQVTTQPLDATGTGAATAASTTEEPAPEYQHFIQAGTYSTEANAQTTLEALNSAGLQASVRRQRGESGDYWIVLVGPLSSRAERNRTLRQVKGLGYPDAFLVRG